MTAYCQRSDILPQINKITMTPELEIVLDFMINAASRNIDRHCNRPNGFVALSNAVAREYAGSGDYVQLIEECVAITLVETKQSVTDTYTAWASADWIAFSGDAEDPDFNSIPYDSLMTSGTGSLPLFHSGKINALRGFRPEYPSTGRALPTVRVTAKWGYSVTVPDDIKEACIIQVSRWWKRGQSGWADAMANADLGQLMFVKALDPAIEELLHNGRYVRPATGRH